MTLPPGSPAQRLAGRVAIVTGIDSDHARAIALALAGAGMAVALVGSDADRVEATAAEIAEDGGHAFGFALRGDDLPAIARLVAHVEQRLGPIDLLVHREGPSWESMCAAVSAAMAARGHGLLIDARENASAFTRLDSIPGLEHETPGVSAFVFGVDAFPPEVAAELLLALATG